ELVDALGSGPSGGNTVEVRVLSWAPQVLKRSALCRPFFISSQAQARSAVSRDEHAQRKKFRFVPKNR
ncbi:hypothetical protein, partial [Burkholderia gladioli]|uniref:hypothetical protein n=1 Tax=Burkholderia gladioli TaxID=28095 RepID=UPI001ABB629C